MGENVVILYKLVLVSVLSGLIGLERETHGRAAGFRTHILVGIGSCLIMLTSVYMYSVYGNSADPSRIAAQVVSGIGFLGAGTIIRFRASIRGLTTAASLWAVAGIGLAIGVGLYLPAIFTTIIILIVLFLLAGIEKKLLRKSLYKTLQVETTGEIHLLEKIRSILSEYNVEIKDFEVSLKDKEHITYIIELKLRLLDKHMPNISEDIARINGIKFTRWIYSQT
ncbi:MAG: MgtC/SapB family protein [Candidatus Saelkia tenebricola]|nr:MgtC/SapB family protein [Candidatus Saelkia tenebricola]